MTNEADTVKVELGPDGKEWAKTLAGEAHTKAVQHQAVMRNGVAPLYRRAIREAFVAGAEWQEARRLPHEAEGKAKPKLSELLVGEKRSTEAWPDAYASPSSLPDPGVAEVLLQNIVNCTHRPNPTDRSRIDVAPGKHREFQHLIERATIYLAVLKGGQ